MLMEFISISNPKNRQHIFRLRNERENTRDLRFFTKLSVLKLSIFETISSDFHLDILAGVQMFFLNRLERGFAEIVHQCQLRQDAHGLHQIAHV